MKLSDRLIRELQAILKNDFGIDVSTEETHQEGIAIVRFLVAKHRRHYNLSDKTPDSHKALKKEDLGKFTKK